jgi:hypothetical protein
MKNLLFLKIVFIVMLFSTCFSQIPESVIPNFNNLKAPSCKDFKVNKSKQREFNCTLDNLRIRIIIPNDEATPCRFVITVGGKIVYNEQSYTPMTSAWIPKVYLCDINQDGCDDIFVVGYNYDIYVNQELGSDSPMIYSFLRFKDKPICYNEMSSIGGSIDLFKQYSKDGQFQFACIKFVGRTDNGKGPAYFVINVFQFINCWVQNVTHSVTGFPIYFKMNDSIPLRSYETLKSLPIEFRDYFGEMENANGWEQKY